MNVAPETGPQDFTVQVSGSTVGCTPNWDPQSAKAYLDHWGLGVFNEQVGLDLGVQGQVQLDGTDGGEYLRLEFQVPVKLTCLIFASVGLTDKFGLVADGQQVDLSALFPSETTIKSISNAQGKWPGEIDFQEAAESLGYAKVWDIVADPNFGDGIQLENICVVPVPEPSMLSLWLIGLVVAGFALLYRRRSIRQQLCHCNVA